MTELQTPISRELFLELIESARNNVVLDEHQDELEEYALAQAKILDKLGLISIVEDMAKFYPTKPGLKPIVELAMDLVTKVIMASVESKIDAEVMSAIAEMIDLTE